MSGKGKGKVLSNARGIWYIFVVGIASDIRYFLFLLSVQEEVLRRVRFHGFFVLHFALFDIQR